MKRILIVSLLLCAISTGYSQVRIGGGLAFGTDIDDAGIFVDGEFFIKNNLSIAPDFIYYFWDDPVGVDRSAWELNANIHYYFVEDGPATVYALGGLNLSTVKYDYDPGVFNGGSDSDSDIGLNVGIGANFDIGAPILPFGEFKFTAGAFDQAVLKFGIRFNLN